jgi:hypothetical protein
MLDRHHEYSPTLPRRRTGSRTLVFVGALALVTAPFLVSTPVKASLSTELSSNQSSDDWADDSTSEEPLASSPLVFEEDEGAGEVFWKMAFYQAKKRAQLSVRALHWRVNPELKSRTDNPDGSRRYNLGDITRPWDKQTFRVTGFMSQAVTITGTSDETRDGDVLFNNADPAKPPGPVVEFNGNCDAQNKMLVTISRVDGFARRLLVTCNALTKYTRRMLVNK